MTSEKLPKSVDESASQPAESGGVDAVPTAKKRLPPIRNKGGAPKGNRNRYRHGLFSPRGPKGNTYIDKCNQEFRRSLEDQVLAAHGEVSILAACLIQTATEASRVALAELTEVRTLHKSLKPLETTAKREKALRALELRDRKIAQLGITWRPDAKNEIPDSKNPWQIIDEENQISTIDEMTKGDESLADSLTHSIANLTPDTSKAAESPHAKPQKATAAIWRNEPTIQPTSPPTPTEPPARPAGRKFVVSFENLIFGNLEF